MHERLGVRGDGVVELAANEVFVPASFRLLRGRRLIHARLGRGTVRRGRVARGFGVHLGSVLVVVHLGDGDASHRPSAAFVVRDEPARFRHESSHLRVLRLDLLRLFQILHRGGAGALRTGLQATRGAPHERLEMPRLDRQRRGAILHRRLPHFEFHARGGAVRVRRGGFGIERDGERVRIDGGSVLARLEQFVALLALARRHPSTLARSGARHRAEGLLHVRRRVRHGEILVGGVVRRGSEVAGESHHRLGARRVGAGGPREAFRTLRLALLDCLFARRCGRAGGDGRLRDVSDGRGGVVTGAERGWLGGVGGVGPFQIFGPRGEFGDERADVRLDARANLGIVLAARTERMHAVLDNLRGLREALFPERRAGFEDGGADAGQIAGVHGRRFSCERETGGWRGETRHALHVLHQPVQLLNVRHLVDLVEANVVEALALVLREAEAGLARHGDRSRAVTEGHRPTLVICGGRRRRGASEVVPTNEYSRKTKREVVPRSRVGLRPRTLRRPAGEGASTVVSLLFFARAESSWSSVNPVRLSDRDPRSDR